MKIEIAGKWGNNLIYFNEFYEKSDEIFLENEQKKLSTNSAYL